MAKPRGYTQEEMQELFLKVVRAYIDWWAKEARAPSAEEKLAGLAHSILSLIDGSAANVPAMRLVPDPDPSDKEYHKDQGENWWRRKDLAGGLASRLKR